MNSLKPLIFEIIATHTHTTMSSRAFASRIILRMCPVAEPVMKPGRANSQMTLRRENKNLLEPLINTQIEAINQNKQN